MIGEFADAGLFALMAADSVGDIKGNRTRAIIGVVVAGVAVIAVGALAWKVIHDRQRRTDTNTPSVPQR